MCAMVNAPTPEEEDRRPDLPGAQDARWRASGTRRLIKGLLFAQGVSDYEPLKRNRRARLEELKRAMAAPCRRT